MLLLLVGTAFTTYQITNRITYYSSYPTHIDIRVEHAQEMRFPTVTICNENAVTLSGASYLGKLFVYNTVYVFNKMLSYRKKTALQGAL